jgi:hypothetical protein
LQADARAAAPGMHSLDAAPAPGGSGDSGTDSGASNDAGPSGLVDRMLKKAAVGIGGMSGVGGAMGVQGGMQTALTPQPPKMAVVNNGRAGVSPSIQGATEPDARYQGVTDPGRFAEARSQVPAAMSGGAMAKSWTSTAIRPDAQRDVIVAAQASQVAPASGDEKRWRAMSGSNLRDILTIWAQNEHVKLVWDSPKEYSVKESMSQKGNFEGAVEDVLQQYSGDGSRPVGQLYRDPAGHKVLIIRQDRTAQAGADAGL